MKLLEYVRLKAEEAAGVATHALSVATNALNDVLLVAQALANNVDSMTSGQGAALTVFVDVPSITGIGLTPKFFLAACMTVSAGTPGDTVHFHFQRDGSDIGPDLAV